ncbi:hypothetical protein INS49_013311 [Diaporthe citri]|uniref:uncharacterized protein n=1 Tax=Diaporthe citri TaxID=83186 RepID=UPI001C82655C|nr:uncharacterized protein INS49_013311 [Diaporthe citri]KAG6357434.1 hypothetical protein INS49_013311 [Diaporthe citri]
MSDWSREASKMCDVYSRSALTISVPICEESSQSFLAERRKGYQEQNPYSIITYKENDSDLKGSLWMLQKGQIFRAGPWFLESHIVNYWIHPSYSRKRWLQRGWTFQEWMLSPRVLHIDSMTLWDCFVGYANEINRRHMTTPVPPRGSGAFGLSLPWEAVVAEYSQREVTHEKDVMPAIAGLAARYAQAAGHTYLAGLWLEDMPRSLLWERTPFGEPDRLYGKRNAPSWSWASLDGPVVYTAPFDEDKAPWEEESRHTARACILSVFCQYDPPDSFSAVVGAWIDVSGRVSAVTEQGESNDKIRAGDTWWHSRPDQGEPFPDDVIVQANVYLLLLTSCTWQARAHHGALVLQECGWEDDRQCFKRLGVAYLECEEEKLWTPESGFSWEARTLRLV